MRWKVLVASFLIVVLVAFVGSMFTRSNSDYYREIRPEITPPNSVFPIVWNILFFMIALSLYFSWIKTEKILILFGVNFLFNILWSLFYFTLQNPLLAFIDLILLWFSILILIIFTYRVDIKSSILLWPYFGWVSFAGILNYLSI